MNVKKVFNNLILNIQRYFSKRNREYRKHWKRRVVTVPGMTMDEYYFNYSRNRHLTLALKRKGIQKLDQPFNPWTVVK